MTLSITNKPVSSSASPKFVNSILKGFGTKLKNVIFKSSHEETQSNAVLITQETDPEKLELEHRKALVYSTFCDQIYIFLSLSKRRGFSIKYLDCLKETILRNKNSLFSQDENLRMLFLIDLVKEIRKLRQKIYQNKGNIYNRPIEDDINKMICQLYNNLPENTYERLRGEELELECKEIAELKERAKELYPHNLEAQESYLRLHGIF